MRHVGSSVRHLLAPLAQLVDQTLQEGVLRGEMLLDLDRFVQHCLGVVVGVDRALVGRLASSLQPTMMIDMA